MWWLLIVLWIVYEVYKDIKVNSASRSHSYVQNKTRPRSPRRIGKLNVDQISLENLKLNEEQQALFNKIENSSDHFFITGKAGTGKSVLLQYLKYNSKKRLVVGAFTGVAALNVGGQTLNSLFELPWGFIDLGQLRLGGRVTTLMRHVDMLVIDEVSMVRVDMMGAINKLLQQARGNSRPFGGVQIIMFGDLYQLPPVTAEEALHEYFAHNHGGPYFFNAEIWLNTKLKIHELTYIFRQQTDEAFKKILNAVRKNEIEEEILELLNERCVENIPTEGVVTLATRNSVVDETNKARLKELQDEEYTYQAEIVGNLERSAFPTDEFLKLKKGAQVMLLRNDPERRWVNGTVGIVESLSNDEIKVRINGNIVYSVPRFTWNKIRYFYDQETRKIEQEILSSFTQFPLKLAWAFTIHKSQGKTYNSVVVNMDGGAFAHGQTYVALSRCTTLEGLYLTQPIQREDIIVDPLVETFMAQTNIEPIEVPVVEEKTKEDLPF